MQLVPIMVGIDLALLCIVLLLVTRFKFRDERFRELIEAARWHDMQIRDTRNHPTDAIPYATTLELRTVHRDLLPESGVYWVSNGAALPRCSPQLMILRSAIEAELRRRG